MSRSATRGQCCSPKKRSSFFESLEGRQLLSAAVPAHVALARRTVDEVALADNIYTNGSATVTWAGINGATKTTNASDCTTYITALLKTAYGFTSSQMTTWFGSTSPNLDTYYDKAAANSGWEAYTNVSAFKTGDLFIANYIPNTDARGHMGIVESLTPTSISADGTKTWKMTVIDCTGSPHSSADTRAGVIDHTEDAPIGDGYASGVGRGYMQLYTDLQGNIKTWSWSAITNAFKYDPVSAPIELVKIPPVVNNATFSVVTTPSVSVDFQRPINLATVVPGDLVANNTTTGQTFTPTGVTANADASILTFTLPATATNGDYKFSMAKSAVSTPAGTALAAAFSYTDSSTFLLAGDVNRDRVVNFDDLLIVASNYTQSGKTFSQGNLDYDVDGNVDFNDLLVLAKNYGATPTGVAATSASATAASAATSTPTTRKRVVDTVF